MKVIYIYIYIRLVTYWPQRMVLHYISQIILRCNINQKMDEHWQKSVILHLMKLNHSNSSFAFSGVSHKIGLTRFDSFLGDVSLSPLSIFMSSRDQFCWSKKSNSHGDTSSLLCSFYSVDDGGSGQSSLHKWRTKWFGINPRHMMWLFGLIGSLPLIE